MSPHVGVSIWLSSPVRDGDEATLPPQAACLYKVVNHQVVPPGAYVEAHALLNILSS